MPQEQIKEKRMLLEQLYNISIQIKDLFLKLEINEAVILIDRKDKIIKKLSAFKDIKDESLKDLKEKIKQQEKENIELSKSIKERLAKELKRLNKNAKMSNLYSQRELKGSIVDITE